MAGGPVMELTRECGAAVLPVDSEHSAIFQAMRAGGEKEVERIIITASGGACYGMTPEELENVTPEDALKHPNWSMGRKITVDSATLMNKALEVIEARWLFDLPPERIGVWIHPQSIVHGLVEFVDGSVVAQMGPPDMKLPIQYALAYPERLPGPAPRLDPAALGSLEFEDEQAVAEKPVAEVELLEFYSARPVDMAIEGLTYAIELLPSMAEDLAGIAQDLRSANLEEGLLRFHECLGYIGWYVTLVNAAQQIITTHDPNLQFLDLSDEATPETDLSQVQPPADGPELKTFASRENLRQKLKDMEAVQENKDNLLLADQIEYEILPIVKIWADEVPVLLKQVQAEAGMA